MPPEAAGFHFAQPWWLGGLLAPFICLGLRCRLQRNRTLENNLKAYADPRLLPHLIVRNDNIRQDNRRLLLLRLLIWAAGILAMAGPRWDYTEIEVFRPGSDLVILLDLSRSMEAMDVKPSRIARARQEIEDLINLNNGARIGLIGFASVAHTVAPLTEDMETLRHLLPSLSPAMLHLPGSRLSAALERARLLLGVQSAGNSRAVLLLSDGDFVEQGLELQVRELHRQGIRFYALGIGEEQGSTIPDPRGGLLADRQGQRVISRLQEERLQTLVHAGNGFYRRADYRDEDTRSLLARIKQDAPPQPERNPVRVWNERFYWPGGLMLILLAALFRRDRLAGL